ncbi:hypothetical protein HM1_0201 [Heliomicrobium modesticaldum Ice1]|uniref:Uncharacterized protein n=1 Tax=Heliobacterium modesticaldum (strain ATCC 51547 / Ice1) TaxID=498761 RepID=B0TDV8_HELMI|nr:hypothetical protein HM1_0201 [Heliomicrobium modesticaldum Ice1]
MDAKGVPACRLTSTFSSPASAYSRVHLPSRTASTPDRQFSCQARANRGRHRNSSSGLFSKENTRRAYTASRDPPLSPGNH